MLILDGSTGEGGGQILRTSLSLSIITGKPFRIENIRARRKSPGLLRQHLTAVNAASEICGASVEGAQLGSVSLAFIPGRLRGDDYSWAIGTAGSTMLVLQTVMLPLCLAPEASTISIEGGTHNPSAPPFDFVSSAFLPLLERMGARVVLEMVRPGFYPAGGGRITAAITPSRELSTLVLTDRGEIEERHIRAVVANLPWDIAKREAKTAAREMEWDEELTEAQTLQGSLGPGNFVTVTVGSSNVREVFTAFGERGVRAEQVAHTAAKEARRYINSGAAVGEHLADQLLLPMALGGGGAFTTTPLTDHSTTNIEIIKRFLEVEITCEEVSRGVTRVSVR